MANKKSDISNMGTIPVVRARYLGRYEIFFLANFAEASRKNANHKPKSIVTMKNKATTVSNTIAPNAAQIINPTIPSMSKIGSTDSIYLEGSRKNCA